MIYTVIIMRKTSLCHDRCQSTARVVFVICHYQAQSCPSSILAGARNRQVGSGEGERRLTALGDTALDALKLDVVGVVGLDIGGETVQGALDGFFGG